MAEETTFSRVNPIQVTAQQFTCPDSPPENARPILLCWIPRVDSLLPPWVTQLHPLEAEQTSGEYGALIPVLVELSSVTTPRCVKSLPARTLEDPRPDGDYTSVSHLFFECARFET